VTRELELTLSWEGWPDAPLPWMPRAGSLVSDADRLAMLETSRRFDAMSEAIDAAFDAPIREPVPLRYAALHRHIDAVS
jgi:hypothetical protein